MKQTKTQKLNAKIVDLEWQLKAKQTEIDSQRNRVAQKEAVIDALTKLVKERMR